MTGVGAGGVPSALRRREAFVGERLIGARDGEAELAARLEQAATFRDLKAARETRAAGDARLVAVAGGPNWIPIGPMAVLRGQASTRPVVSGRVKGIGVSADGRRVYLATAEGGVWRSGDAGLGWEPMSDSLDLLEVPPVALPPGTAPASSLATGAIALVDGGDAAHDRLYVGTGEATTAVPSSPDLFGVGMLRSDDGGRTWVQEPASASLLGRGVFAIAVDPDDRDHAVAATTNGVFRRTAASAATATPWTQEAIPGVGTGGLVTGVAAGRVGGATRFFAAVDTGPVAMRGTTGAWTALPSIPALPVPPGGATAPLPGRITLAASAGPASLLYALVAQPLGATLAPGYLHGLFRIDPSSATPTWAAVSGVPPGLFGTVVAGGQGQGWYDQGLAVDPTSPSRVYVGGSGLDVEGEFSAAIYRLDVAASGGGLAATATLIGGSAHADVHALLHVPGSATGLWVGCDGGAYVTDNALGSGNRLFAPRNEGLGTLTLTGMAHLPGEDSYAFCGAQDNGGLRYLGSEVWDHQLYGDGGATVIDWAGRRRLLSIYHDDAVRRSEIAGARYITEQLGPGLPAGTARFYPPMVNPPPSANPGDAALVALGADVPRLSSGFGDGPWTALPARSAPVTGSPRVRALAFASASLLWAGWEDGHLARYDLVGGSWVISNLAPIGITRPITSIAIDPATPGGEAVYVTLGGASGAPARVWQMAAPLGGTTPPLAAGAGNWTAAGAGLLDVQHSAIVVDQADPTGNRRWVGADVGVWAWNAGAGTWQVLSAGLPDAAVLELALLPTQGLLRAATYGRGVWELPLAAGAQPAVALALRATAVDRGRPARQGIPLPASPGNGNVIDDSPDIAVDAPGPDGRYVLDPAAPPTLAGLTALGDHRDVLVSVPEAPATTRVYVTVRNRGTAPGNPAVDGIRVALLIAPAGDDETTPPGTLPAGFEAAARDGTVVDADGWKTVGIVTLDGLRAGTPRIAAFDLRSDLLPPVDAAENQRFALLALVDHADDRFPAGASRDPVALVIGEPRAALRRVAAVAARGAATGVAGSGGPPANPPGGSGLLLPLTTALLARQRLSDLVDQLTRKATSTRVRPGWGGFAVPVTPTPVERRVLAMASGALAALSADASAGVPRTTPGAGVSRYALLGALGYELPGFTSVLAPGGSWISDAVRRGTPDPDRSRVAVPASELPLAVARAGLTAAAADAPAQRAVRGFSLGMLAAAAAGVAVGPQMAGLLAADTNRDWHWHSPSTGAGALERHLRLRFLGGETRGLPAAWLPAASAVPPAVWSGYVTGLEEVYGLHARRPKGFGAFETGFDAGDDLTAVRLRNAYGLVLDDLRTSSWSAWAWFGLLAPVVLAPSAAILVARELPNARGFFGGRVTERSVSELLSVAMGLGSIAPLVYSMILWAAVDEHTEMFGTSLGFGFARAGLVLAQALRFGRDETGDGGSGARARWGLLALQVAPDVYAAIRAALAGSRRPGVSTGFALQTLPALTGVVTLAVSGLLHGAGIDTDWPFWLAWSLFSGGMVVVGALAARALAAGGGWRSWFIRSERRFPLLSSVAAAGLLPAEPLAAARVYDDSTLWADADAAAALVPAAPSDLAGQDYPSGMRALVRVWWEGAGTLEVRHDADLVTLRAAGVDTPVRLPAGTTAASLAQLLLGALAGVRAQVVDTAGPDPALAWPGSLADPGDDGPAADAPIARARFVPVGTTSATGVVLRHAPRADLATRASLLPGSAEAFPVIPLASLGDLEGSGLGAAADLAVLLAVAAAPSLGPVPAPGLAPPAVAEVVQVFRRWNLDERRLAEWQGLVSGVSPAEGAAPPGAPDALLRKPPIGYAGPQPVGANLAAAMGWIPLWRAWLRIAADLQADAAAAVVAPSTPLVRFSDGAVRRPTNAELTEGVRFLLDLPAT